MINPKHAASDYFGHLMNMYQGDDHPQAGYRCEGGGPKKEESWRFGSAASESLFNEAVDIFVSIFLNATLQFSNIDGGFQRNSNYLSVGL